MQTLPYPIALVQDALARWETEQAQRQDNATDEQLPAVRKPARKRAVRKKPVAADND